MTTHNFDVDIDKNGYISDYQREIHQKTAKELNAFIHARDFGGLKKYSEGVEQEEINEENKRSYHKKGFIISGIIMVIFGVLALVIKFVVKNDLVPYIMAGLAITSAAFWCYYFFRWGAYFPNIGLIKARKSIIAKSMKLNDIS